MRGAAALQPALKAYYGRLPVDLSHYGGYYTMTPENWPLIGPMGPTGAFVVGAPNAFVAEMLDQRMHTLISQTLNGMVGSSVHVRFQVIPDYPTANGDRVPESPPVPPGRASADSSATHDGAQMNPKYVFERFIVGKSNELAHAAALAVSERPGRTDIQ